MKLTEHIRKALADAGAPITIPQLRERVTKEFPASALSSMVKQGSVIKHGDAMPFSYSLAPGAAAVDGKKKPVKAKKPRKGPKAPAEAADRELRIGLNDDCELELETDDVFFTIDAIDIARIDAFIQRTRSVWEPGA